MRHIAHVEAVGYGLVGLKVRVASLLKLRGGMTSAPVKKLSTSPKVIPKFPPTQNRIVKIQIIS